MIKSAIFEPNLWNMSPKSMLLVVSLLLLGLTSTAQYTEKINTNRPGVSQGAFSVGNNVLQLEGGLGFGRERHKVFDTKSSTFNFDYNIRYGLLIEQLEISLDGSFRSDGIKQAIGANEQKIRKTDFESNTIGVKYLIYDPYKKPKENDSITYDELKSWKKRYRFKWKSLIPAISAYAGMNYVNTDNAFTFPTDATISPKIVIMTQNNWWTSNAGSWVLVTNLIVDKITTDNPAYGWIITSTHTLNDKWAIFGEYQGQKSDFYSDNIIRLGGAYLWNQDLQIDANIATNFKDTPSIFRVSLGASYRFDWHRKDEIIEKPGFESGIKNDENEEEEEEEDKEKDKDDLELDEEIEEIENDSLKQEQTPFINDFEDGSHRDAMEKDLDERRTEQRLERERIEKEKKDKKDEKKFKKEERRRLKREAKAAKQAKKAKLKAEKEKQKMIEDIDAELDKMEQDEGVDDELKQINEELEKLEEIEKELGSDTKTDESKEAEDQKDIDAAYEKLQKEQEKAKKEEEKRKKAEEKRRKKEEKKRKKEEEKRKKAEEKKRKKAEKEKNDNDDG